MFIFPNFFLLLFLTIVQCQNITVRFPRFPVDTDIGYCTCDLRVGQCDVLCCCDPDCTDGDEAAFGCSARDNQYTNSTPVISTVQPSCFKNLSIFRSNSPYIIQKMGELVCVDYERYKGSQYYQQPNLQVVDASAFVRAINTQYSVAAPSDVPASVTNYQVGTPILATIGNGSVSIYSLPLSLFNGQLCSGSQAITYMNDFTSTCSQLVDSSTCSGALNPTIYTNSLCFIPSPSRRDDNSSRICSNTSLNASSSNPTTCLGALQSLNIKIFYSNPTGIIYTNLTVSTADAPLGTPFFQTFTVQFIKNGLPASSSNTTRNPGYRQGATIIAGTRGNGSTVNDISSTQFSILKPSSTGFCGGVTERTPIRFGENIRSTCKFNVTPSLCPNLLNQLIPINSNDVYVAAYSNADRSNITRDWLPVISCTSQIGIPNQRVCINGIIANATSDNRCYIKLDIQIAYTNIGSIFNPQPVLSAIIFHYQGVPENTFNATASTTLLMGSVMFQDISKAPIVEEGRIPTPNTRLPANFFYPFSVGQGMKSLTFSSVFYFLISALVIRL